MREAAPRDSAMMLGALGILAYAASMMTHEALGHGGYCLAAGGHNTMLTAFWETCHFPGAPGPGIKAAGPCVQFGAGLLAWLALHLLSAKATRLGFFLWLYMVFNLLVSSGYVAFSGVTDLGDAAELIAPLHPLTRGDASLYCSVPLFTSCPCERQRLNSSDWSASMTELDAFSALSGFLMPLLESSHVVPVP